MTALVLHLNGPPGVGKSTLARRWAEEHPGTLLLDVDALRTWISGWREDYAATARPARGLALAMVTACAAQDRDVVVPQLIGSHAELDRLEQAATSAGGRLVEVFLDAPDGEATARFATRARDRPWLDAVHDLVAATPEGHLDRYAARIRRLIADRPGALQIHTVTGRVDAAYADLLALVGPR